MSDLRNIFKSKDFVINSNIIKCIKSLDISLDEFLLILYFINISCELNTEDIKDKLGFDEDTVFNTFNSLINKKYIEMDVKNNNSVIIEMIKLDPFYDTTDIYSLFEQELGRTLSSFEYEIINKWIEKGISEDTIKRALKEAILNGVTNFKYIDKIIYDWSKNNVKQIKKKETLEDLFDYDWLDDNE